MASNNTILVGNDSVTLKSGITLSKFGNLTKDQRKYTAQMQINTNIQITQKIYSIVAEYVCMYVSLPLYFFSAVTDVCYLFNALGYCQENAVCYEKEPLTPACK